MSSYFVDPVSGFDSTGTGAVATPWKTISHAITGGTPGITMSGTGDTLWLIPSGPARERNVVLALTPGVGNVLTIAGDYDGTAQRAAGSSTPIVGIPTWTAYMSNDITYPGDTNIVFSLNGKNYVTMQDLHFIGGRNTTTSTITAGTTAGTNVTIQRCSILSVLSQGTAIMITVPADVNIAWLIDSCRIFASTCVTHSINQSATAEWTIGSTVQNSLLVATGGYGILVQVGTTSTFNGYGVTAWNNTVWSGSRGIHSTMASGTGTSTNFQVVAKNNTLLCGGATSAISCVNGTNSHIFEDYNGIYGSISNVTSGNHSPSTSNGNLNSPTITVGQESLWGFAPRSLFTPFAGSTFLGLGTTGGPALDITGRNRPEGGGSLSVAVGHIERHDTGAKEASIVQASTNSLKLSGPSSQEVKVAVDAVSTTISIYMYADSNHGTGTPPQAILVADGEIGIAGQTLTMSPTTTGQWNLMTFAAFTPSAKGVVTLRLVSRPTAANGIAYFDTLGIA